MDLFDLGTVYFDFDPLAPTGKCRLIWIWENLEIRLPPLYQNSEKFDTFEVLEIVVPHLIFLCHKSNPDKIYEARYPKWIILSYPHLVLFSTQAAYEKPWLLEFWLKHTEQFMFMFSAIIQGFSPFHIYEGFVPVIM